MEWREVDARDIDLICRHREKMFREAGSDNDTLRRMAEPFRAWLLPRLIDGSYFGFVLLDGGVPIAGIGLMSIDWPPHPLHPTQDKRGYVLNVYTEKDYRRRGLARQMMALAESAFQKRNIGYAILHATTTGRPLYRDLGWTQTSEMAKSIDEAVPL
ncbi:GNAT family acetyltransferase [Pseudomonas sp. FW306-02-F02-AA]|uniref:GNAT family acetyltransferase n=1 Tax=Pseudomonas fluorescens TaxID=294 RepID=A0A0N9VRR2_PSEFL|nr:MULTISPECIES: GNAT family N-acetyltransferase [Pseudomonas]ALI00587.1 GNAT family acetyltransferase [Pseudomonas fluorescens]PMZ02007.1 GNAT family acetyltransferase [Pseudomonas sp. FW306-02-F02-AB]PMZ07981.1 GNAT family acetyltransferase [Pseudomonas sp. FW306-02-H06C]PMZ12989.1 GNAT family acetyltransferase [Pseudomonas sp. FW306-02-F02-AA]PMZ19750.1 GNAT family acetyltransferase [Pseudomonas sp. FW306-02-F08-AA]